MPRNHFNAMKLECSPGKDGVLNEFLIIWKSWQKDCFFLLLLPIASQVLEVEKRNMPYLLEKLQGMFIDTAP